MKKILAFVVVLGCMLNGACASTHIRNGGTPGEQNEESMKIVSNFFTRVVDVANTRFIEQAKVLGIHTPPQFCSQYVGDVKVVDTKAMEQARKEHEVCVCNLQTQIASANEAVKEELEVILRRFQKGFDNKLARVAEYEVAVNKLITFQRAINDRACTLVADMQVEVARLGSSNPEALKLLCDTQLEILKQIN